MSDDELDFENLNSLLQDDNSDEEGGGLASLPPARKKLRIEEGPSFTEATEWSAALNGNMPSLAEHLQTDIDWASLHLSRPILRAISDLGYKNPTPVQRDTIPAALAGKDILGMAETGSGKTAAFLIPSLERLVRSPNVKSRRVIDGIVRGGAAATKALILLPTRELAEQCFVVCRALHKFTTITSMLLLGGRNFAASERIMRIQPDVVVATPGRCLDLIINSKSVALDLLEIVVFDEADRLIEFGFKEMCLGILKRTASQRQTLFFSASLTHAAKELAVIALSDPVRVPERTSSATALRIPANIELQIISVGNADDTLREPAILQLLSQTEIDKRRIILFFNTKLRAKKMFHLLSLMKGQLPSLPEDIVELHGDIEDRGSCLQRFQSAEKRAILLTTNLAARGLDLPSIDLVINAELPADEVTFTHRVGRTGRQGQSGLAITVITEEERPQIKSFLKKCTEKELKVKVEKFSNLEHLHKEYLTLKSKIRKLCEVEKLERTLKRTEIKILREENVQKYKEQICLKPLKTWIELPKQKRLKVETKEAQKQKKKALANATALSFDNLTKAPSSKKHKNRKHTMSG